MNSFHLRWLRIRWYRMLYNRYMTADIRNGEWPRLINSMQRLWERMTPCERQFIQRTETR